MNNNSYDEVERLKQERELKYRISRFIPNANKILGSEYGNKWHSKLSSDEILDALSKDIYEPIGIEYEQFLLEHGLKPEINNEPPSLPIPPRTPMPPEDPNGSSRPMPPEDPDDKSLIDIDSILDLIKKILDSLKQSIEEYKNEELLKFFDGLNNIFEKMKINFDLSFCLKFLDALTEYEKLVQKIKKEKNQTPKNKHSDTTINKTPTDDKGVTRPGEGITRTVEGYNPPTQEDFEKYLNENTLNKEYKVIKVVQTFRTKIAPFVAAALAALMLTGMGFKDNISQRKVTTMVPVTEVVAGISYEITKDEYHNSLIELSEEDIIKILSELNFGETLSVENGDTFYSSSTKNASNSSGKDIGGLFDKENKYEGNYPISGCSIIDKKTGNIINYVEYFYGEYTNVSEKNIGKFVENTLANKNLSLNDVDIELHMGITDSNNKKFGHSRLGWININDLLQPKELSDIENLSNIIKTTSTYSETVRNFSGDTVSIETDNGTVSIPVMDENGNLLSKGSYVVGSDGNTYQIQNLKIEEIEETTEKKVTQQEDYISGKRLVFDVTNCNFALAALPMLSAMMLSIYAKKKNKESKDNPYFDSFSSQEDYDNWVKKFKENLDTYYSKMNNKIVSLFIKIEDEMVVLNNEQVTKLKFVVAEKYRLSNYNQVVIENGHIFIQKSEYEDMVDITDFILPDIKAIGDTNVVVAEGLLDKKGIRR